jgi:hypothetical protein
MFQNTKTLKNPSLNASWTLLIGVLLFTFQLSAQGSIDLYNRWKKSSIQVENGKLAWKSQGNNAVWAIEKIPNSTDVRIKHVPSGNYLHAENGEKYPAVGPIQSGWWSAMWSMELIDEGFYLINNKHRGTYLHTENGVLEMGPIKKGWHSAHWLEVPFSAINGRVSASPPTGNLKIRGVYIIPSDQQAKPKAREAIAEGLKIMQDHFWRQLGVTFEYEPEVAIIYSNHNTNTTASLDVAVELCKKTMGTEYENNKNIMFTVVEGCPGVSAFGTPGATRIQKGFWDNVYNAYINNPQTLASTLPAWSHELGHAFGLNHTGELTKDCMLKECKIDMGTLPSLLMQQSKSFSTVYEYPFHKEEKKMLLDSTYCPKCLIDRGTRPAAVYYLRLKSLLANDPVAGAAEFQNRWSNAFLQHDAGKTGLGAKSSKTVWVIEKIANSPDVYIKNQTTGAYLHTQNSDKIPETGTIQPGWWSAMWTLEDAGSGFVRIRNKWRGLYLHNQNGGLEIGNIQTGWWSAQWKRL